MSQELEVNLQHIGIPFLPGRQKQIEFFEQLLAALLAGHGVGFKQTRGFLKLEVYKEVDRDELDRDKDDRQHRIKLVRRTLVVLREGLGYLVATMSSPIYFEFWVECPIVGGLPPHRWTSLGWLYNPSKFKRVDADEFGLSSLNPTELGL